MCACILWKYNKHGIGLQASPLWCGKCSRYILCVDILHVQSTICLSHLHCNLMLSIFYCAFYSFRPSLYRFSIKFEGTKAKSEVQSRIPRAKVAEVRAIAWLQRMPSRPIRSGLALLGSSSLCSVMQPACSMTRAMCRLRASTYVTQLITGCHRSPVDFSVMLAGLASWNRSHGLPALSLW